MSTPMELLDFDYVNPIKCIYHRPIGKKYVVPHWHEAIEIAYIAKGNPGTMYIDDNKYELHEGEIYIINSRLIHNLETTITCQQRIVTLLINYDWLRRCLPKTMMSKAFDLIRAPKKDNQMTAFNNLTILINQLKDFKDDVNSEDKRLHQLAIEVELISILVKNFTIEAKVKREIPDIIADIIFDFHENYQMEIQLSEMAQKYNYSYAYFSKLFKRYLGISPKKYITLLRTQQAAELIENTDKKFNAIASEVGFPDEKSFYASFKEKYGQTPMEYRNKTRQIS